MKKLCFVLAVIMLTLSLVGCGGDEVTTTTDDGDDTTNQVKKVFYVEKMTELDGVVSVVKNEQESIDGCLAYDLVLDLDGVYLDAQIVMPQDYRYKDYSTVLYFPETGLNYYNLRYLYASNGVIVVRLGYRSGESVEQKKDFCGKDYEDVKSFFEICKQCDFLTRAGITVFGSSEGSVRALKLAVDYPNDIMGCAVIDVISDIESFMNAREESIRQLFEYQIGGSIEDMPEEYQKRSAIYFADKIDIPVMILAYKDHPLVPMEQATKLRDAIISGGGECEYQVLDEINSDFGVSALYAMNSWYVQNKVDNGFINE